MILLSKLTHLFALFMIDGMNSELCFRAAHFLAPIFSYRLPLDLDLLDISVRAAPLPWKLLYFVLPISLSCSLLLFLNKVCFAVINMHNSICLFYNFILLNKIVHLRPPLYE
jgi:hypothetical protein